MTNLPGGTVTFVFTDIEGSTRLAERFGPVWPAMLEDHRRLLREAFVDGAEISTEGDSFFFAFDDPRAAVAAAASGQRALVGHEWPEGGEIRVRMGIHTGNAQLSGGSYVGLEVHRAARVASAGHGGQVLLSEAAWALASRSLPDGTTVRDLGRHRLKDLSAPERLFELVIPGVENDFRPLVTLDERPTNLPVQLTSFVGRERELAELTRLVRDHRLTTVIGTGGTGKTRLALRVAGELVGEHVDGAWLVELAPLTSDDVVAQEVARSLGVQPEPGRSVIDSILDFVRLKQMLLVLDNCEHLIGAVVELVGALFHAAPSVRILATSREALGVAGEAVYQVPSLPVPAAPTHDHGWQDGADAEVAEIARSDAVALFVERATLADATFRLDASNAAAVAQIARRLDGIPLAIELAAARVRLLSVQDIEQRLGDRFRLLTGGSRTALPRQQTLRALIDWSWDLLDDADRGLLCRLAAFVGGFTLEAAASVTGGDDLEVLEGIGRLVDRSLVIADRGTPTRYRILETIRQYGRDRLVEAGDVAALRDAHMRFYLQLVEEASRFMRGPRMVEWLDRLDADSENIRAALDWAMEVDRAAALRLSVGLEHYWRSRSLVEGLERMRAIAPSIGDDEGSAVAARALSAAATIAWLTGNATEGLPWAARALEIWQRRDETDDGYEALDALAMSRLFSGHVEGVEEMAAEAVEQARRVGDLATVAFTEGGLAQFDAERGDLGAARARHTRATEAAARSANPSVVAFTALSEGRVAGFAGDLETARRAFDRAIGGYRAMRDRRLELVARSDLAHAVRLAGHVDEAERMYRDTLHDWVHAGNRGAIANQLESLAAIDLSRGELVRAARLLGAAEAIREAASAPMLPTERRDYDAMLQRVRYGLAAPAFQAEWATGRAMGVEEAVALALGQPRT